MPAAPGSVVVIASGRRCRRVWMLNGAAFWVWWAAAMLLVSLAVMAASVTRFAPGAALPQRQLAVLVVPDPEAGPGQLRVLPVVQLAEFRRRHPQASLVPPAPSAVRLETGGSDDRRFTVEHRARPTGVPGVVEVDNRTTRPLLDSPGSFAHVEWRYRVGPAGVEPLVLVEFDPFMTWFAGGFLAFFLVALAGGLASKLFIGRPLARGRWLFLPPLNRDWLFTFGIPMRFEPAPAGLDALAAALRSCGARVSVESGQGALAARLGRVAVLRLNRVVERGAPARLELLLDPGLLATGSLLLVLVAPLAALLAIGLLAFDLLDPFARFADDAAAIGGLLAVVALASVAGRRLIAAPAAVEPAERLLRTSIAVLATQGSQPLPPRALPRLRLPLPRWRRRLPAAIAGLLLLALLVALLA